MQKWTVRFAKPSYRCWFVYSQQRRISGSSKKALGEVIQQETGLVSYHDNHHMELYDLDLRHWLEPEAFEDAEYARLWGEDNVQEDDTGLTKQVSSLSDRLLRAEHKKTLTDADSDSRIVGAVVDMVRRSMCQVKMWKAGRSSWIRRRPSVLRIKSDSLPKELTLQGFNGWLEEVVMHSVGCESMQVGSALDLQLQQLVAQLVPLQFCVNQDSLNWFLVHFARLQEIDMVAVTVTNFEAVGVPPNAETFNVILWCLVKMHQSGRLTEADRAQVVVQVIHKMCLRCYCLMDSVTFDLLLQLVASAEKRTWLIEELAGMGLPLLKNVYEVTRAYYSAGKDISPRETSERKSQWHQRTQLEARIAVLLEKGQVKEAVARAQSDHVNLSSRTVRRIMAHFISRGQPWHTVACANWFAANTSMLLPELLMPFLTDYEYVRLAESKLPEPYRFLGTIYSELRTQAARSTPSTKDLLAGYQHSIPGWPSSTVSGNFGGVAEHTVRNLVWRDLSHWDTSLEDAVFCRSALFLGYKGEKSA